MTWSNRLKSTFNLFKKIALPLYLWYLIYLILFGIVMLVFFYLPPVKSFIQSLDYFRQHGLNYPDELIRSADLLNYLPLLAIIFILFAGVGLIMTSLLYTGIYHLTVKGFKGQAFFSDFKLRDAARMIGWNAFILVLFLAVAGAGFIFFAFLDVLNETLSYVFAIIYPISVGLISLFFIPWILCGGFYILVYTELPFLRALVLSWSFFRRNMGALWGAVLAMFVINMLIVLIQDISSTIGGMISFIATPFFILIPIVWTLTLISEQERLDTIEQERLDSAEQKSGSDLNHSSYDDSLCPTSYHDSSFDSDPSHDDSTYADPSHDDSSYDDSAYHTEIETVKTLPHYKPRKEDSPPGYYHTPDHSKKSIDMELNGCPTCGTRLRSKARYCSKCGVKLR